VNRRKWKCLDCKIDTGDEHYFVHTTLWLSAVGSKTGMLCIGCLERRIGRKLTPEDFTAAYINHLDFGIKSVRLVNRLMGK
jgi:hypothetical protein